MSSRISDAMKVQQYYNAVVFQFFNHCTKRELNFENCQGLLDSRNKQKHYYN